MLGLFIELTKASVVNAIVTHIYENAVNRFAFYGEKI